MLTSVVMQVSELKEKWDLEAEEEQASINICNISEDKSLLVRYKNYSSLYEIKFLT